MDKEMYSLSVREVEEFLKTGEHGLTVREASDRLSHYGANSLPEKKPKSIWVILFSQFESPLIYILLVASVLVFLTGERIDAGIILSVLIFNSVVGTIQEGRAQNTLRALRNFVETKATVYRDGREVIIADRDLVPGDVIFLYEGEKVPADARIVLARNLKIDEAPLTGESEPVDKIEDAIKKEKVPVSDQRCIVFKGTHVVSGNGKAIVIATGGKTAIGKIAQEISFIDSEIPLKANIRHLSRAIINTVGLISASIFIIGLTLGFSIKEMFATVVSLSVSIIPEGLPIVMTLVLATGVWRMSKRNALVKKLQAVEALGQARVIAVDKTGTITRNELVVRGVWTGGKEFEIGGVGYEPKGDMKLGESLVVPVDHEDLIFMGRVASLSAAARLSFSDEEMRWKISGDPTEASMLVFSEKAGFKKEDLLIESPQIADMPFDYRLKYHAAVHNFEKGNLLTVIGAPETILSLSTTIRRNGKNHQLTKDEIAAIEVGITKALNKGMRVIAVGVRANMPEALGPKSIHSLTFAGFFAMQDGLRPEVAEAMRRAISAGIKVVMITGDHKLTAKAIAKEASIYKEGDQVLLGEDIDKLSDADLAKILGKVTVFARVTPEHKLRIVKAYKKRGEIIAMTGDGVNDAPSLVAADLGVSMGVIGTEVAKEASDIVLLDDNFSSIISAIEEGRNIYKTIKKVILYLFSTSLGEVLTITGALILGFPLPIIAAQIIWLNFVTDGFLDVALAMEPKEEGLLDGSFERPKKYLVDSFMIKRMVLMALPMMVGTLFLFSKYFEADLTKAWTISLTTLAVFQWFNAWNCRSEGKSIFMTNPFSNKYLVGATAIVISLQLLAVYNPFLQHVLRTVPLNASDWILAISVATSIIVVEEIRKFFFRRKSVTQKK